MDKFKQLEMALAAEQLSSTAAVAALHLQRSNKYSDNMISHILWEKIKEYEKISDKVVGSLLN